MEISDEEACRFFEIYCSRNCVRRGRQSRRDTGVCKGPRCDRVDEDNHDSRLHYRQINSILSPSSRTSVRSTEPAWPDMDSVMVKTSTHFEPSSRWSYSLCATGSHRLGRNRVLKKPGEESSQKRTLSRSIGLRPRAVSRIMS